MKGLVIGLGGVGTVAAYTLQQKIPVYALVRSNIDQVKSEGFKIKSVDYGDVDYKPTKVVGSLAEACEHGPYDYIVVATKVIPKESGNIWDYVKEHHQLYTKDSSIVLMQNGINIEKYWHDIDVNLISGVSYISSIKTGLTINQVAADEVSFGLFKGKEEAVTNFVEIYENSINKANINIDNNVRFIRMRKLLYNASFNTLCCLTNTDIGIIFDVTDMLPTIKKLMKEIQTIANKDLSKHGSAKVLEQEHIDNMIKFTKEIDVPVNYEPSMLVDFRNGREIELEVILGNLLEIHTLNGGDVDDVPNLNFLYNSLKIIQYKLEHKKV